MNETQEHDPKTPSIAPGDVVAEKYEVERIIAVGGMGVVVAAKHRLLENRVALKFVHALQNDKNVVKRLLREAQIVSRMKSEHVVRVHDVGVLPDGAPYIVMELLEGEDLEKHLRSQGALALEDAVGLVLQACEALAEAHAQGVVHRDVKPSNLFLTTSVDQRPLLKVLDFGVSKARTPLMPTQSGLTRASELLGTPAYMSPEQLRAARDLDHRADIWSLGVIFHEMLSGKPPFAGRSLTDLSIAIVHDPTPALPDTIAPDVREIVRRCLEKKPADRFQSIGALAEALAPMAPAEQRETLARIRRLDSHAGTAASTRPSEPSPVSGVAPSGDPPAMIESRSRPAPVPARNRRPRAIATGVVVLFALASTAYGVHRTTRTARDATASANDAVAAPPATTTAPLPPLSVAPPVPAVETTAGAAASVATTSPAAAHTVTATTTAKGRTKTAPSASTRAAPSPESFLEIR